MATTFIGKHQVSTCIRVCFQFFDVSELRVFTIPQIFFMIFFVHTRELLRQPDKKGRFVPYS